MENELEASLSYIRRPRLKIPTQINSNSKNKDKLKNSSTVKVNTFEEMFRLEKKLENNIYCTDYLWLTGEILEMCGTLYCQMQVSVI